MTAQEFNDKYRANIPEGWGGLEFDIPQVTEFLDKEIAKVVEFHPTLEIHQIKLKFGMARFYTNLDHLVGATIAVRYEFWVENEINRIIFPKEVI
jgi:hypothetical protein